MATGRRSTDEEACQVERTFAIDAQPFATARAAPGLFVVATPIGNLEDITVRALKTLAGVDAIACEDTRRSRTLLDRYAIRARTIAYHEHNAERVLPQLIDMLGEGASIALISDAGTPLVSDPGFRLVRAASEAGHPVVPIPGPSAPVAALSVAGLPCDTFLFAGFLPAKAVQRRKRLTELSRVPATQIFFEAPHRLVEALAAMAEVLGPDRPAVVARELTKAYETLERGTLGSLAAHFAAQEVVKGEIVVLVAPPGETDVGDAETDALLRDALERLPAGAAAATVAQMTGRTRKDLYRRALELKDGADD